MDAFVTGLCSSLSSPILWSCFGMFVPFLAISVLFGLGMQLITGIVYNLAHPSPSDDELREDFKHYGATKYNGSYRF